MPREPLNNSARSAFQSEKPQIVRAVASDSSRRYGRVTSRARCGFSGETLSGRAFAGHSARFDSLIWNNQTTLDEATPGDPAKTPSRPRRVVQRLPWGYLRELGQTEYMKRSAGILSYDQQRAIAAARLESDTLESLPGLGVDAAMAAHDRMMARPDFIEWLPVVTLRLFEVETYRTWLQEAHALRSRIDVTATIGPAMEPAP